MKYGRNIEYKMSKETMKYLLKNRKGTDAKMNPQEYLCKYVNEELGLMGNCVNVLTFD